MHKQTSSVNPDEFELIKRYFTFPSKKALLGVGDDCALLTSPTQEILAISSDMLVEGQHFFAHTDPQNLGHKALAVNLSDLAAMGAQPLAFTLALALPSNDSDWLAAFSRGLSTLAQIYNCELIGGDTTRGPLTICITILGTLPVKSALRRDAAQVGDDIWVSGHLGDARLALAALRGDLEQECFIKKLSKEEIRLVQNKLEQPEPRIELGLALRQIAHAAIDISDGLISDLSHITCRSGHGASIFLDACPRSAVLAKQNETVQHICMLAGGDDYELCFTAPAAASEIIQSLGRQLQLKLSRIGKIETQMGLRIYNQQGQLVPFDKKGFNHFS